jgi:diacylglycerol kinase (ATP)
MKFTWEELEENSKKFSVLDRIKSTNHAWRGVGILLRTTHNAWVHIFFGFFAIFLGFKLNISEVEWAIIILAIGLVIVAEAFNTAIEIDIDLTSPEFHPYARDTKDMASGAVLLMTALAGVVGLIIFGPKIWALFY